MASKRFNKNISINKLRKNKMSECTIFTSNIYIEIAFLKSLGEVPRTQY